MKQKTIAKLFYLTEPGSEERDLLTSLFEEAGKFDLLTQAVLRFMSDAEEPAGIAQTPHGGSDVF